MKPYYRARYYDASPGRFTSEDPLGFIVSTNFYSYAANEPTLLVDEEGLAPRSPRHLPDGTKISCRWGDNCKVLEGKIWAFNWLIEGHIGFDLRPNYPGKPHTEEIEGFNNGLQKCLRYYRLKCGKNRNECSKASQNPDAVRDLKTALQYVGIGAALGGAAALAPETGGASLAPVVPYLPFIPRLLPSH